MAKKSKQKSHDKPKEKTNKQPRGDAGGAENGQFNDIIESLLPAELETVITEKGVPPREKVKRVLAVVSKSSFSSPLPPPNILEGYKLVDPKLVDVITDQITKEQDHRHKIDKGELKIREGEFALKRRGQTIAAWITPLALIVVGFFAYSTAGEQNQVEVLKTYLWFVLGLAGLFVTGRLISGIEKIFSKNKE